MLFPRASGILLHPTSLPGRYGIGDLGKHAYHFVDYLQAAGQTYWQVLPLGPTSYGDSPYQALSAFAGNANLISLDKLIELGWLTEADVAGMPEFPDYRVDYGPVIDFHNRMLTQAYERFTASANAGYKAAFTGWCEKNAYWLNDYALFIALKMENGQRAWVEWPEELALARPDALKAARERLAGEIDKYCFRQWLFFAQWDDLKTYANARGIRIIGDLPIFVAHDSSDVWANRHLFTLDERGKPTTVAGVPPDYFSITGQYWGNPLYKWDLIKADGYRWWIDRMRAILEMVDLVRIDHFRAFEDYWEIPVNEARTAVDGEWVKGPNVDFFHALKEALGELPIIAEDLGEITVEVEKLRDALGLPGMKVLQFGWSDPDNEFLPHNYTTSNCVVYTGTHDNNTVLGWWMGEGTEGERAYFQSYIDHDMGEPHWEMIRLGMMSVAHTFIAPLQDVLGFGSDTRMNTPGVEQGNWSWRFSPEWLNHPSRERLAHFTRIFARVPALRKGTRGERNADQQA